MADGNHGAAPIPARDEAPYRVSAIEHRTPAIVEVWLRPMDQPMAYRPREYVLLEDAMRHIPPRSYSIANAPRPDGLISLLITRVAAGPTSVSPIRALIEAALEATPQRPLTLIFSARTVADVLDRERFGRWQTRYPPFVSSDRSHAVRGRRRTAVFPVCWMQPVLTSRAATCSSPAPRHSYLRALLQPRRMALPAPICAPSRSSQRRSSERRWTRSAPATPWPTPAGGSILLSWPLNTDPSTIQDAR
jgi:hypothetical protein